MKHQAAALLWIALYTFFFAPLSPLWAQSPLPVAEPGITSPQIQHQPAQHATMAGDPLEIEAVIAAGSSVEAVLLYRKIGASEYTRLAMRYKEEGIYRARIPGKEVVPPGIEYFIQATDAFGNMTTYGQPLPAGVFKMVPLTARVEPNLLSEDQAFTERIFPSETAAANREPQTSGNSWYKKWWVWTIVGVVATGIVAASMGGGSGDPGAGAPATGTLTITGPVPGSP